MNGAIKPVSAVAEASTIPGPGPFSQVFDAVRSQEGRIQSKLSSQMSGNKEREEFTRFLDQTFDRLQSQFTDPMQKQTFDMVKREMKAANDRDSDFVEQKIRNGMKDIQLELALKATGKTSQGLQQLLSSQ